MGMKFKFSRAVSGVMTLFRSSLYTVFEMTVLIKTFLSFKLNLISFFKLKGSSALEVNVFNNLRHSTGKASITEISLNISNGEIFNSLNL